MFFPNSITGQITEVPVWELALLDKLVRVALKRWLGIHQSTCNGLFYSKFRDRGLGLPKLSKVIPAMQGKRIFRFLTSEDKIVRELAWRLKGKEALDNAWLAAGG